MFDAKKFSEFVQGKSGGIFPIAHLNKRRKAYLQTAAEQVFLSKSTFEKQIKHGLGLSSYVGLQNFLNSAEWEKGNKPNHFYIIGHSQDGLMVAVIKVTENRKEVYLQSYRRTDKKQIASWQRKKQA